ncbi:hypothetical protein SEMRO_775_G200770.1 [Seminavis robusta]|uniref:Uncharacterized protein n=1 Tax=Seminavis robusta TaxID=568900 RepID=A0A9N8E9I0_9STRA|nr:hypothetical protein SEMRO_775_G200770.1 [Seminavis robusta]|eukprot:Sro775_g200770.1 n/a (157) ;mRNA; r:10790-11405
MDSTSPTAKMSTSGKIISGRIVMKDSKKTPAAKPKGRKNSKKNSKKTPAAKPKGQLKYIMPTKSCTGTARSKHPHPSIAAIGKAHADALDSDDLLESAASGKAHVPALQKKKQPTTTTQEEANKKKKPTTTTQEEANKNNYLATQEGENTKGSKKG